MISATIQKLLDKQDLTLNEAKEAMNLIMSGKVTDAQIAEFLMALRQKGETIDEITACAKVMREKAERIKPKNHKQLIDVVGTGGDSSGTFNISTAAALVVAGADIPVAKHGNKSVSSKSGSADVLTELGVNISLEPKQVEKCIEEVGIGFMFAPKFHKAMKYAIKARKDLGVRTIFNILGPLTNPAEAPYELMGVFNEQLVTPLAEVLGKLGAKHALVVHGNGLDEITLETKTKVAEYKDGHVTTYNIQPTDFNIKLASKKEIQGNSPKDNAKIILNILNKKEKGPKRDITILNAAAAIYTAGKADSIKAAIKVAENSIDSGKALEKLNKLKVWTNK